MLKEKHTKEIKRTHSKMPKWGQLEFMYRPFMICDMQKLFSVFQEKTGPVQIVNLDSQDTDRSAQVNGNM